MLVVQAWQFAPLLFGLLLKLDSHLDLLLKLAPCVHIHSWSLRPIFQTSPQACPLPTFRSSPTPLDILSDNVVSLFVDSVKTLNYRQADKTNWINEWMNEHLFDIVEILWSQSKMLTYFVQFSSWPRQTHLRHCLTSAGICIDFVLHVLFFLLLLYFYYSYCNDFNVLLYVIIMKYLCLCYCHHNACYKL